MAVTNLQAVTSVMNLSPTLADRLPVPSVNNMKEISQIVTSKPVIANEFMNVLFNEVGLELFSTKMIENPLKIFKKGKLEYGDQIRDIFVDIVKGKDFNAGGDDLTELFGKAEDNTKVDYATKTYKHYYKTTVSIEMLRRAFKNEGGLMKLVQQKINSLMSSANYDEMCITMGMLDNAKMKELIIDKPIDEGTGKKFTKAVKTMVANFGIPSNLYNEQGVTTFSSPNELVLVTTPTVNSEIDVEVLANAFNMSKADINTRVLLVPGFLKADGKTPDNDCIAKLIDINSIQIYDTLQTSEEQRNARHLYTNYFLHNQGTMYQCKFVNAVEFRTVTRGA